MMKLYGYWRSSASYRIRIALALKGIEVEHIAINLKKAEHQGSDHVIRNPQRFVPVLELADGTRLTQSLAIIDYLESLFPEPALLPENPVMRARVRAAAQIIAADIAPIQNLRILKYIPAEYGQDDEGLRNWASHWIAEGFKALESLTLENNAAFLLTETPSLAECCLVPQIYNARRFGVDMAAFPNLQRIDAACRELPTFKKAAPEAQPDAPKD